MGDRQPPPARLYNLSWRRLDYRLNDGDPGGLPDSGTPRPIMCASRAGIPAAFPEDIFGFRRPIWSPIRIRGDGADRRADRGL
jgi:hypothetical protein